MPEIMPTDGSKESEINVINEQGIIILKINCFSTIIKLLAK